MILGMTRVRILGPRERLRDTLGTLQDLETVHLDDAPPEGEETRLSEDEQEEESRRVRWLRQLRRADDAVGRALDALEDDARALEASPRPPDAGREEIAGWVREARSVRRRVEANRRRSDAIAEEKALLKRSGEFLGAFENLLRRTSEAPGTAAYQVLLDQGTDADVELVRKALDAEMDGAYELWAERLAGGETGLLLLVRTEDVERFDELFTEIRVQEVDVPDVVRASGPEEARRRIEERLEELSARESRLREERRDLARRHGAELAGARAVIRDRILEQEAMSGVSYTARAFVLHGWLPTQERAELEKTLRDRVGEEVVVEDVDREEWTAGQPPVVLRNPRLFRPFEPIVNLMPLPRYGTMDPTPFVAVFFPMFFGLILGDVAYGLLLSGIAFALHLRSDPGTTLRSISEIAGACGAFTVIFGFVFGEFLGDLGRRAFGLEPLLFDREEALLPFLGLAVALGAVHLLLGLVLNIVSAFRGQGARKAVGPGVTLAMVVVTLLAILAAVDVLPRAFFTPAVIVALVAFPILIVVEGLVAPVELLSTLGRILSYARIMALGTASVMMAVAANRMIGALGSVVVGALFALLFHAVNFVLGVFSPTIHALRLHYVEFFGTFYSSGGTEYQPFGHWNDTPAHDG